MKNQAITKLTLEQLRVTQASPDQALEKLRQLLETLADTSRFFAAREHLPSVGTAIVLSKVTDT